MSVQARFYVSAVRKYGYPGGNSAGWAPPAPQITVDLAAVGGKENAAWASATPSGKVEMTIGNPAAAAWFEERIGQVVAITFADPDDIG